MRTNRPGNDTTDVVECDAVVVGARVAGASTALMLARAGLDVIIVDRVREPSDTLSTHILWPAAMHQLERMGLHRVVASSGAPAVDSLTVDNDGASYTLPIPGSGDSPSVHAPRRSTLDPLLLAAAERAGVAAHMGISIRSVTSDPSGRVDGVVGTTVGGRPWQARSRYVIGADGLASVVARHVGAREYSVLPPTNAAHYAYWSGLDDRGYELWYRSDGLMAGVVPTDGGACVFVNCRRDLAPQLRVDIESGYWSFLRRCAPDLAERLGSAVRTSRVRGTPGIRAFRRVPGGAGWVLVGDAGYTKDPASGHGITAALLDAERAALAITRAVGGAPEQVELDRYQSERDDSGALLYETTAAMADYGWDERSALMLQARFADGLKAEALAAGSRRPWSGMPFDGRFARLAREGCG